MEDASAVSLPVDTSLLADVGGQWSRGQKVEALFDESIGITVFNDDPTLRQSLVDTIVGAQRDPQLAEWIFRGAGGTKVHAPLAWGCPVAKLVNGRAMALYRRWIGSIDAVVDSAWANIYQCGDYCMPHSHLRANASIVYMLDPGDPDLDQDPFSGRLCFVDPRLAYCAPEEKGRLTRTLVPDMPAGCMVIFPGGLVHAVNPYNGTRPRISMSWNINSCMVVNDVPRVAPMD